MGDAIPGAGELLKQGNLGIFVVLLIIALGFLFRSLQKSHEARFADAEIRNTDAKEWVKTLEKSSASTTAMSVAVENTNRLNEQRLEVLRGMVASIASLAESVKRLEDKVDRLSHGERS